MTSNHLLLHHLAERMLEEQHHVLAVDELFDDDVIADFVKSIQIDSPYQQMLLEGVLTESVRDEKLFVSFTVEGYFHFVLGDVIFNLSKEKDHTYFLELLHNNQLNGVKEGVEQCLIRDINSNNFYRIHQLIDIGEKYLKICIVPFASAIIKKIESNNKKSNSENITLFELIKNLFILNKLNGFCILIEVIKFISLKQNYKIVEIIQRTIISIIKPSEKYSMELYIMSINSMNSKVRFKRFEELIKWTIEQSSIPKFSNINCTYQLRIQLCRELNVVKLFDKSLLLLNEKSLIKENLNNNQLIEYIDLLAETYNLNGNQIEANKYYYLNLEYIKSNHNVNLDFLAQCYHNVALTTYLIKKSVDKDVLDYFEQSISIMKSIFGSYHDNYSKVLINYANVLSRLGPEFERIAIEKSLEAIKINSRLHGVYSSENVYAYSRLFTINGKYFSSLEFQKIIDYLKNIDNKEFYSIDSDLALNFGIWYRDYFKEQIKLNRDFDLYNNSFNCLYIENLLFGYDKFPSSSSVNFDIGQLYLNLGNDLFAFDYLIKAAYLCSSQKNNENEIEEIKEYLNELIKNSIYDLKLPDDLII